MPDTAPPIVCSLVSRLYDLDAQIAALQEQRKEAARQLIAKGEGLYIDDQERKARVVKPTEESVSFDLFNDEAKKAFLEERKAKKMTAALKAEFLLERIAEARKLAGEQFRALFDRIELFSPCKAFAELAPKLLTPAKARDVVALCKVTKPPADAYVKLLDKDTE